MAGYVRYFELGWFVLWSGLESSYSLSVHILILAKVRILIVGNIYRFVMLVLRSL
jgi:hypothetical protein